LASVSVGQLGVDYSGYRPAAGKVRKDGANFIIRYSAGAGNSQANTQWKLCGKGEIAAAVNVGMDFIANSEWYESRITEGAGAGKADGTADLAFWKSRGLAKGATIYVSWDAAPLTSHWAGVDAYLKAYNAALKGYYHVGAYAGTPYLKHALSKGIILYGWRPNAGSWSNDGLPYQPSTNSAAKRAALVVQANGHTPAAIWQTGNYWYSKNADENLIVRPNVGSHLQALRPKPPVPDKPPVVKPIPKPPAPRPAPPAPAPVLEDSSDMPVVTRVDEKSVPKGTAWPGYFELTAGKYRHIPASGLLTVLEKLGVKPHTISYAEHKILVAAYPAS
jgi:hypothetical protein